ncbi:MAG: bifunctional hydroxymethylpyrimidine kinase/phosphomethylpyrimidine kinase [Gemmatimonadota bacterium]
MGEKSIDAPHSAGPAPAAAPARPPVALTIAGSDSGGGAGIQADLKTFHAFGVFGTSVLTAVTAQNTLSVRAVHVVPIDNIRQQLLAVAEDLPPAATKSGMLATAEIVDTLAEGMVQLPLPNYVLDPVMVATSGDRLLDRDAEQILATRLLPLCALVTPNLPEAAILTGREVRGEAGMIRAAERLVEMGAGAALVKGGHGGGEEVVDVLAGGPSPVIFRRPRIATSSTHGTGCTLSAAIAAGLAHGRAPEDAVGDALDYVTRAIETAPGLGAGHGPLNHLVAGPSAPSD